MPFNSLAFAAFLAVSLLAHRLPLSWRTRKLNLLLLSYAFYASWNPPLVGLLWIATVTTWYAGKWMFRARTTAGRRAMLGLSLVVNLGMLSFFKYGELLSQSFATLMQSIGIVWQVPEWNVVLPIGISFYTFQTLSYALDIYWRRVEPWDSFLDYSLFVTFFPQLVAGPIVRAGQFHSQCKAPQRIAGVDYGWGMALFSIGLFQKVFLADVVLAPWVERVYDASGVPSAADAWIASLGFGAQIYCDFAGYTLCAIGVARCLGFALPTNFRFPLAAVGFQDFWSRWHISLSTWLRDYVFVSARMMTAAAKPALSWTFSILLTWSLIGLWHGASWTFVVWGFMCGLLLLAERAARALAPPSPLWRRPSVQLGFAVFQFAMLGLTIPAFRAGTFERMAEMYRGLLLGGGGLAVIPFADAALVLGTVAALFTSHWLLRNSSLERVAERMAWPVKSALLAGIVVAVVMSRGGDRAFIYFRF